MGNHNFSLSISTYLLERLFFEKSHRVCLHSMLLHLTPCIPYHYQQSMYSMVVGGTWFCITLRPLHTIREQCRKRNEWMKFVLNVNSVQRVICQICEHFAQNFFVKCVLPSKRFFGEFKELFSLYFQLLHTLAHYTLFTNNDKKGTNGRNLCEMRILCRE